MRVIRKELMLLLAITLFAGSLAGCGRDTSKKDSSESVLQRLKDAKDGKDVYGGSPDRDEKFWGDPDFEFEEDSGETETVEYTDGDDMSELSDADLFINPEYKSVTGDDFKAGAVSVLVPDGR